MSNPKTVFFEHVIGAITKQDKDNLQIKFSYTGNNWIPLVLASPGVPAKTQLDISIDISLK
jgi:hypothetical protein